MSAAKFARWEPLPQHYVDPEAFRLSQFAQSHNTRNSRVAQFQLLSITREANNKPRIRVTVPAPQNKELK